MAQFQDNEMEFADDDYDMVEWDEFYLTDSDQDSSTGNIDWDEFCLTDSGEDSSTESKSQKNEMEYTDLENSDEFDMSELQDEVRTIAYQKESANMLEYPAHIKRKEEVEIKDVVKEHVLPFLPAKSLVRFKTVSKDWDQWIANPFLAHKQSYLFRDVSGYFCQYGNDISTFMTLNQSAYGISSPSLEFLPEPVVIRSSCNGLLLCQGWDVENVYYVCNPASKEWTVLPRPHYYHGSEPAAVLAFEPSMFNMAAEFELVCAFRPFPFIDVSIVYFEIYSSEKRSWRRSAANCIEQGDSTLKSGFYMKGMAYWETSLGNILAFDMINELCGILPLPSDGTADGVLTQMHGELCYIRAHNQYGNFYKICIYGGMDMSLKHNIAVSLEPVGSVSPDCQVLPSVNSDVIMLLVGSYVYSYHVRDQTVEVVSRQANFGARYLPYVNSLVSVATQQ